MFGDSVAWSVLEEAVIYDICNQTVFLSRDHIGDSHVIDFSNN